MKRSLGIVTGGTKGIGFGIASELIPKYDLALTYASDSSSADQAIVALKKSHPSAQVYAFKMDLCNLEAVQSKYKEIKKHFNCSPEILINNAGRSSQNFVLTESIQAYENLIFSNFLGPVFLTKLVCADMARRRFGRIISISSSAVARAAKGLSAYSSSKCAFEVFSNTLGHEMAKYNITVNVIRPGLTETEMTKESIKLNNKLPIDKRFFNSSHLTKIDSIAQTVTFLIGATQINRAIITIDGGIDGLYY